MAIDTPVRERTVEDYKSDEKPTWCPGCGDFGVLNAVYRALRIKSFEPHQVVAVSGIGCSSRIPYFISTYGFHGIHGRTMPIATGVHVARLDLKYVVMDNAIYGLTKGQTSPTSGSGFNSLSTPQGNPEQALNPMLMAVASGATFVARGFSAEPQKLADLIVEGINHKGFSFIDVYSPCPTFNKVNTFKTYKEAVQPLPADHDASDPIQAMHYANSMDPLYLGVFHKREAPTFGDQVQAQHSGDETNRQKVLEGLFNRFS